MLLLLTVVAIGGGAQRTAAQATPAADPAASIDLSGVDIRLTGVSPSALSMVTFQMVDILEGWGASIDYIELSNTTGVQALIAGQTDLAAGGTDELILGAAAGADIIAVGSTQDKMDYVLIAREGINSIADLKGKSIGMSGPAGYDTLLSRLAVKDAGLGVDDVNFVQIGGSGDRAAAVLAGRIDAATIFISDWFELDQRTDDVSPLVFMTELVSSATKSGINTTRTYAQENPDLMFALACANLEAYQWFNASKDDFVAYTLENVEGSTAEATGALYDLLIEIQMYPMDINQLLEPEGVQAIADIMFESGEVTNQVTGADLVDRSYLEAAFAAGCGQ
jgi:NitT/TauT family transport system substrate-binding protein